jgi:hypothetical protein
VDINEGGSYLVMLSGSLALKGADLGRVLGTVVGKFIPWRRDIGGGWHADVRADPS